jgi:hypothetical protein
MLAGWINRHQRDMIEYLKAENKILRKKLRKMGCTTFDKVPEKAIRANRMAPVAESEQNLPALQTILNPALIRPVLAHIPP